MRWLALSSLLLFVGCPASCGPGGGPDGGEPDGGHGVEDAGTGEDAGVSADAGPVEDAGSEDAGAVDGGEDVDAGGPPVDAGEPPPGAWGTADDPLPEGASVIPEEDYALLMESGEWVPTTPDDAEREVVVRQLEDAADDAILQLFADTYPDVVLLPPNPTGDEPGLEMLPDGNYLLTLAANGPAPERQVVTMGERWWRRSVADALRRFPTRENQYGIYEELYGGIPDYWAVELGLTAPPTLGTEVTGADILNMTRAVLTPDLTPAIIESIFVPGGAEAPPRYLANCMDANGASDQSDEFASSSYAGDCALNPDGIVARYDFPLRDHMTCVKDQGDRGTCTGFASTGAIEVMVSQTHGVRANLSEQAFYNRGRLHWANSENAADWTVSTPDGLLGETALQGMKSEAWLLYFENQWPYNGSFSRTSTCVKEVDGDCWSVRYQDSCVDYPYTCSDAVHQGKLWCTELLGAWTFCGYVSPPNNPLSFGYRITGSAQIWDPSDKAFSIRLMKALLSLGKPLVLGHPITGAWSAAANGDGYMSYVFPDAVGGGHGSLVVGYIDNDDLNLIVPAAPDGLGGGYFIVRNSWGNCSGDGGFIYVPYASVLQYTPDVNVLFNVY